MQPETIGRHPRPPSIWLRRCLLVVVGPLAFLCILEGALRISGFGAPSSLFIPDDQPSFVRTNPQFTDAFLPPQFDISPLSFRLSRHKTPGHFRVFVLGESAVRGIPEPGISFVPLLRAQLRAAYPGKHFDVYNLGIVAINSHAVLRMADEAAKLEPDLFVVYMGNNEVVGPFGPGSATRSAMPPLAVIRASLWSSRTRTGQLIARLIAWIPWESNHAVQWRGMGTFTDKNVRGDDPRLEGVYHNFRENLAGIVAIARRHSIRAVVSTVVCNLRDSPPFASLHSEGLAPSDLARGESAFREGRMRWELGDDVRSIAALKEAVRLDSDFADAHYLLGRVLDRSGDLPGARSQYLESLHWDALRFRPDSRINAIIKDVAARNPETVVLVDAALKLGSDPASSGQPAGREILWEHVHFNWDGSKLMARLLAEGSAEALFGGSGRLGPWLDGERCADAVGYSPLGQVRMLRAMRSIVGKAPFTNQVTFGEDQVRYIQEMNVAAAKEAAEGESAQSRARITAAIARDPENSDLLLRLSEVDLESGDPEGALRALDRALELEPPSPDLVVRRAHTLTVLNRHGEAQSVILDAIRLGPYHMSAYTELVEILRKTGDFQAGRASLERALRKNPASDYLRLTLADLLFYHGDNKEAVLECEAVLSRSPENSDALGRLVSLFLGEGRKDEAFALMLKAKETQPFNFENDMALAREYEHRHDDRGVAECLHLAELSGPAEPEVHVFLARRLLRLMQLAEARVEFARGKKVALMEGKTDMAEAISRMMPPGDPAASPQ